MASNVTERIDADPETISFAVDTLTQDKDGRVVVTGRWFGVRGRRFVRPTLNLVLRDGGFERRALADLDHKPWAAQDGESWVAAFNVEADLTDAEEIELSVAPDITIGLAGSLDAPAKGKGRRGAAGQRRAAAGARSATARPVSRSRSSRSGPGAVQSPAPAQRSTPDGPGAPATGARAPRVRAAAGARPAISDPARELALLRERLSATEAAHERERGRREAAEGSLESERGEALRLRSEVGRLSAELDLVTAARDELTAAAAELDSLRSEHRATGEQLGASRSEAERTGRQLQDARAEAQDSGRALERARTEVVEAEGRLAEFDRQLSELEHDRDTALEALAQERAETQRLSRELADSESAVRNLAGRQQAAPLSFPRARGAEADIAPDEDRGEGIADAPRPVSAGEHRLEPMSPRLRALNKLEGSPPPWNERPLNPSLRTSRSLLIRALAVIVVLIVVVVVIILINSTVG